jgi:hypothetical protein
MEGVLMMISFLSNLPQPGTKLLNREHATGCVF